MFAAGTVITTADILPTSTIIAASTTTTPNSDFNPDDDDGYDLIIPKLVLYILIPILIVMVLIIVIPFICLCLWKRHKLRNMKYRIKIAEMARNYKDTLEQNRLTQGTYQNTYAESSFTTASQLSPAFSQPQSSPSVPQWRPPVPSTQSPAAQQWQPSVSPSQSPVPQWRPPVPHSQTPVPRSPAPPPPISCHHKPPAPPPPPSPPDELTPLQSTTDVTIEAQVPSSNTGITNRTATVSGGFHGLAAVAAAEAVKRRSTVSTGGGISTSVSESQLQRSASNRSGFHSLGRREQLITPPSSPPPPPINRISPPLVAPKPKKNVNQEALNEEPEDIYEDTNSEPLYEPIPGEKEELGYVDVVPPPFIDSHENVYDDDAGIHAMQEATSNTPYDTFDVPTSQPNALQSNSSDTCDPPASQPNPCDTYDVPTSQPGSYDTYDAPVSQPTSTDASNLPVSQSSSYDTYDVPPSHPASVNTNSCDVPTSSNFCPPPRPPKPPMISQNPLDRLVEDKDPINKYDTNQEVCKLNGMDYTCEVLDLNDND